MNERILSLLKKHAGFISGEEIARDSGLTRAAVWKHIQELRAYGYDIDAVPHCGYRLRAIPDKLYPWEIAEHLKTSFLGKHFFYFDAVDSTMSEAFQYALQHCPDGTVVAAEHQRKGRGRFQRHWVSPAGKGLYFSFILRPPLSPQEVSKLTLLCSVACRAALASVAGLEGTVKWPNDILINEKKICGILTEVNADQDTVHFVIIGIGINVHMSEPLLPPQATSIYAETGQATARAELLKKILEEIEHRYFLFQKKGFAPIREEWRSHCSLWGKRVKIQLLNSHVEGQAVDIDEDGCLLIRTDHGFMHRVLSGDITPVKM